MDLPATPNPSHHSTLPAARKPALNAGKSGKTTNKARFKRSRFVRNPTPSRGKATPTTEYLACSFCQEQFGREVMVSLTYLPTHLPLFHPGRAADYPPEIRLRISMYKKSIRLGAKMRENNPPSDLLADDTDEKPSLKARAFVADADGSDEEEILVASAFDADATDEVADDDPNDDLPLVRALVRDVQAGLLWDCPFSVFPNPRKMLRGLRTKARMAVDLSLSTGTFQLLFHLVRHASAYPNPPCFVCRCPRRGANPRCTPFRDGCSE